MELHCRTRLYVLILSLVYCSFQLSLGDEIETEVQ